MTLSRTLPVFMTLLLFGCSDSDPAPQSAEGQDTPAVTTVADGGPIPDVIPDDERGYASPLEAWTAWHTAQHENNPQSAMHAMTLESQRATAAAGGMFFIIVCGVIGAVTVNAVNRVTGHDFFEVRWGAVYLGISLVLFSIWGYGRETPVEYAERMMSRGKFASATATIERVLEKDPDDLQALKIQQELRQMMTM